METASGSGAAYRISRETADYCRAVRERRFRSAELLALPSRRVLLAESLPPVAEQSVSSTCTAHAVAALVAYAERPDAPPRLSAQFLFDMVKRAEEAWLARNFDSIRCGFEPDAEFRLAYRGQFEQLKLLLAANGGPRSAASARFIAQFEEQLQGRTGVGGGCMIHRCFDVVREYGICREELRPSASVQRVSFAGRLGASDMPRQILEDAKRHRVAKGLRVFEHPNNVNEIRNVLSGARGLRPMPVCVAVDVFEGCADGVFAFPDVADDGTTSNRPLGLHEMLVVGYEDDPAEAGGGRFTVRNSWGTGWGEGGYGRMPYAYLEIFCREAGTILEYAEGKARSSAGPGCGEPANGGGVCGACGKRYLGSSSLKWKCESDGCRERICFDCWSRGVRTCQKHVAAMPNAM